MQTWNFEKHIHGGKQAQSDEYLYASAPCGLFVTEDVLRIFFSKRNINNASQPYSLDYDLKQRIFN